MKIEKVVQDMQRMPKEELADLYAGAESSLNLNWGDDCRCSGSSTNINFRESCECGDSGSIKQGSGIDPEVS